MYNWWNLGSILPHHLSMTDPNQQTYSIPAVVRNYQQLRMLQPAEKTILDMFQDRLPQMKMLDIGVGGGRTTEHFAPFAGEYVGVDYSGKMIAACQQRCSAYFPDISLQVADGRDLSQFADNSFDFILFSFNGIDYVSHEDRLLIFDEICRVGKPGCYFFFSTHNLEAMTKEFQVRKHISLNPLTTYVNLVMLMILRLFNRSITHEILKGSDRIILRDESHNFRLRTYYIRPKAQIEQLEAKFKNIQVYSWKTGEQISDLQHPSVYSDMWLYYLCVIN